jgi:hypothetical protein
MIQPKWSNGSKGTIPSDEEFSDVACKSSSHMLCREVCDAVLLLLLLLSTSSSTSLQTPQDHHQDIFLFGPSIALVRVWLGDFSLALLENKMEGIRGVKVAGAFLLTFFGMDKCAEDCGHLFGWGTGLFAVVFVVQFGWVGDQRL